MDFGSCMVNWPTHGRNILDKFFFSEPDVYHASEYLSLVKIKHKAVLFQPLSGNDSRDVRPRHKVRLRAHNIDHLWYALGTYNWSDITMMTNIDDNVVTTCHLQWNGSSFWQKRSGQVMHPSASTQSRHVFQLQFRASSIDTSRKYGRLLLMQMHSSSGTSGQVDILRTHYWHRLLRTCSQRQHRRPT